MGGRGSPVSGGLGWTPSDEEMGGFGSVVGAVGGVDGAFSMGSGGGEMLAPDFRGGVSCVGAGIGGGITLSSVFGGGTGRFCLLLVEEGSGTSFVDPSGRGASDCCFSELGGGSGVVECSDVV
jgi:hypothetical protein